MKSIKRTVLMALVSTMAMGTMVLASPITDITEGIGVPTTSKMVVPTISITVPTSAELTLNPYGLKVDNKDVGQVISTDMVIENGGDTKIEVKLDKYEVEIEGEGTDKIVLASAPILATSTSVKKDLFLHLKDKENTEAFDTKKDVKKVVKVGAGLNESMGMMDEKDGTNSTLELVFDGSLNAKAEWKETDKIKITPTFKFVPRTVATTTN